MITTHTVTVGGIGEESSNLWASVNLAETPTSPPPNPASISLDNLQRHGRRDGLMPLRHLGQV